MYKLLIKDKADEVIEEIAENELSNDELIALINAPFMINNKHEDNGVSIFLKQRVNSRADELPYNKLKYDHNLKMAFAMSQILESGVSKAKRTLIILDGLDKFERAYDKGILQFTQNDMKRLREDWLATGMSDAFNVSRGIKMLYDLISFCYNKNLQFGKKHEITNIKETKANNLNKPIKSKSILKEDEMLKTLTNDKYSLDSRMILYLVYKGAVVGSYQDEVTSIRLRDLDLENRKIYIAAGLKGEKWLPIYDTEIPFLEKFIEFKRDEIFRMLQKISMEQEFSIENMYIFMKRNGGTEIKPLQSQLIKYRYRCDLLNKLDSGKKNLFVLKNIGYSGMANEYKHKLNETSDATESVILVMRQFSRVDDSAIKDYSNVNADMYRKAKYIISTYS
ncbi:hypothetical protein AB9M75_04250 [Lactobacillus sp. AN1001]